MHVEDPIVPGHQLDNADHVFPLLQEPCRQTGGVRERPSGSAVLDAHVVAVSHWRIVAKISRLGPMRDGHNALLHAGGCGRSR